MVSDKPEKIAGRNSPLGSKLRDPICLLTTENARGDPLQKFP